VVWVFIQHLSHSLAQEQEVDVRIKEQLARLEKMATSDATADLKREVLATVLSVTQALEQKRTRQAEQMSTLGTHVHSLGGELQDVRGEAETDPLTRLFNHKAFDTYVAKTVELFRAFGKDTCLLLVDIDRMKAINESFGRSTGDAVLCKLADGITRTFFRKDDFVARRSSDEIGIVLRETPQKEGMALAERVLRAARAIEIEREGAKIRMTASVGLVGLDLGEEARAWVDRAERALVRAKREGGDRIVGVP
jgi:diguanylate cyclase